MQARELDIVELFVGYWRNEFLAHRVISHVATASMRGIATRSFWYPDIETGRESVRPWLISDIRKRRLAVRIRRIN